MSTSIKLNRMMGAPVMPLLLFLVMSLPTEPAPQDGPEVPRIVGGDGSAIYNFPFLCTILAQIYERYLKEHNMPPRNLTVVAGQSTLERNVRYQESLVQSSKIETMAIGTRGRIDPTKYGVYEDNYKIIKNPRPPLDTKQHLLNAFQELYNDIGLAIVKQKFKLGSHVLPAPVFDTNVENLRKAFKEIHEAENLPDCTVAGFGPLGNNALMFHKVVHVPFEDCREALCSVYPSTCLSYPIRYYHVCYKSDTYGDVCIYDQGAPLFCPWFKNSVLAILVKAFDCGLQSLPGVYTLMDHAVGIYHVDKPSKPIAPYVNYSSFKWASDYSVSRKPLNTNYES